MIVQIAVFVGFLSILLLKRQFGKTTNKSPPRFWYPLSKDQNFKWITKSIGNGTLPKIFRPIIFWQSYRFTDGVIIADFDLIKEAFRKGTAK